MGVTRHLRGISKSFADAVRLSTGGMRATPDFLIIGAQKSGTSSLYTYLTQHPNIRPSTVKEINYFNRYFDKGTAWYKAHFPSVLYKDYSSRFHGRIVLTGEASADYLPDPLAAERARALIPDTRMIVVLRNPVDRAYSHYHHRLRQNRVHISFEEAIEEDQQKLVGGWDEIKHRTDHAYYQYVPRGMYVDQLKVWMSVFPREQFLVLKGEDFFADPPATVTRVARFLQIPQWKLEKYKKLNTGSYQDMAPETRQALVDYYEPHNQRLYEFLGEDFGWNR